MMKLNNKYSIIVLLIIGTFFSSCAEDELNSKELLAYMRDKKVTVHIANETSPLSTTVIVGGDEVANLEVGLSREATVDVKIVTEVDQNLVEQYNKDHQTNYVPVSEDMISLASMEVVIASGQLKDTLRIGLNREKFLENATYLVPVRLSTLFSDDKGIRFSSNMRVAYIVIDASVVFNNIDKTETPLQGTRVDRTEWSTIVGGNSSTHKLYDNALSTYSNGGNSIRIDMQTEQMIKGFDLVNYTGKSYSLGYAPKRVSIYFSTDGTTWVKHGESNELKKPTEVSTTDETFVQVKLLKAQNVRYFKIDFIEKWGYYGYLSEIHALK